MIQAEGLTKYYGPQPAIQDVSFEVDEEADNMAEYNLSLPSTRPSWA